MSILLLSEMTSSDYPTPITQKLDFMFFQRGQSLVATALKTNERVPARVSRRSGVILTFRRLSKETDLEWTQSFNWIKSETEE